MSKRGFNGVGVPFPGLIGDGRECRPKAVGIHFIPGVAHPPQGGVWGVLARWTGTGPYRARPSHARRLFISPFSEIFCSPCELVGRTRATFAACAMRGTSKTSSTPIGVGQAGQANARSFERGGNPLLTGAFSRTTERSVRLRFGHLRVPDMGFSSAAEAIERHGGQRDRQDVAATVSS